MIWKDFQSIKNRKKRLKLKIIYYDNKILNHSELKNKIFEYYTYIFKSSNEKMNRFKKQEIQTDNSSLKNLNFAIKEK